MTSELDGTVRRISPKKNKVTETIKAGIDAERRRLRVRLAAGSPTSAAAALQDQREDEQGREADLVAKVDWITPSPDALSVSSESGRVFRVNPATGASPRAVYVGANPLGLRVDQRRAWVPNIDERNDLDRRSGEERGTHDARS